jgi:23S rRNA pseudouridine955/2504/2580 synthase
MIPRSAGRELTAGPDDAGRRLDKVLRTVLKDRKLSEIYSALRKGQIRVNGGRARPEQRLAEGDRIALPPSFLGETGGRDSPDEEAPEAEDLGQIADILVLATRDLLFINKPRGALSQGPQGLDARIRRLLAARSAASLSFVPGPLHRLDRNTTGLITFPRSAEGARVFTSLIRSRSVAKRYIALVDGRAASPGAWRDRMARDSTARTSSLAAEGEEALAEMWPLISREGRSLIAVELHSGLTHQIRVQASSRGLALSGDRKYGGADFPGGYILHALSLSFPEPPFPDLPAQVSAPLPDEAFARLATLFGREELRSALDRVLEARQGWFSFPPA